MVGLHCRMAMGLTLFCLGVVLVCPSSGAAKEDAGAPVIRLSPKTSFAVYGHGGDHHDHRAARDVSNGGERRFPRQAGGDGVMSYTADETQTMLNAHLEYRRNVTPPAADMNTITWNTELADSARRWAERCVFEHGYPQPVQAFNGIVAQNLWMGSKSYGLKAAVTAWYNEYKFYDYNTASCSDECGHYRIMVFSGLQAVGCGSAICDNGRRMLTVCNYGPSVGSKGVPYKAGPACGLCESGAGWCDNKLCRSDCDSENSQCACNLKCQNCGQLDSANCRCDCKAGWRGTDCSEPCVDYKDYCSSGAYTPEACRPDPGAQKDCPATCALCKSLNDMTPAEDKCCDGKMCDAGFVLDEATCGCVDYAGSGTGPRLHAGLLTALGICVTAFAVMSLH